MAFQLKPIRQKAPASSGLPQWEDAQREAISEASSHLLEKLHRTALTDEQRPMMAQALQEQIAATEVLRRFPLTNEDAPCIIMAPAGTCRDDG